MTRLLLLQVKKSAASSPTPKAQLPSQTEAPKQNAEDEGNFICYITMMVAQ